MTTKEQERKALDKIRKIVAELGEDSYIGCALEGCLEDAETNINDDAAFSYKSRYEIVNEGFEKLTDEYRDLELRCEAMKKRAEDAEARFNAKVGAADKWCAAFNEAVERENEALGKYIEERDRAVGLEQEIVKLKARLYDLLVGQE